MKLHSKINERAMLMNWATDMQRYLVASIANKRLTRTMGLKNSVKMNAYGLATDVRTFVFKFQLKGMFVDMGVFGGKSLEETKGQAFERRLLGTRRKKSAKLKNLPKRQYQWYSRTMYGGINVLSREMMAFYGNKGSAAIKLPEIIEI